MSASFSLSIAGIGSLISRILVGWAAADEHIDEKTLYFGSLGITGVATILLPLYGSGIAAQVFYPLIFGVYTGGVYTLVNPITVELVGVHRLATAFGFQNLVSGIGVLIGPPIAGNNTNLIKAGSCKSW